MHTIMPQGKATTIPEIKQNKQDCQRNKLKIDFLMYAPYIYFHMHLGKGVNLILQTDIHILFISHLRR